MRGMGVSGGRMFWYRVMCVTHCWLWKDGEKERGKVPAKDAQKEKGRNRAYASWLYKWPCVP